MPGSDGVLLLGLPTLKDLGVDPYERIWDSMQQRVSPPNQGVETPALWAVVSNSGLSTRWFRPYFIQADDRWTGKASC